MHQQSEYARISSNVDRSQHGIAQQCLTQATIVIAAINRKASE